MRLSSRAFLTPAVPVTPAGSLKTPQVRPSSRMAARISSSETFTTTPLGFLDGGQGLSAFRERPRRWSRPGCSPPWGPGPPVAIARFRGSSPRPDGDQFGETVDKSCGVEVLEALPGPGDGAAVAHGEGDIVGHLPVELLQNLQGDRLLPSER